MGKSIIYDIDNTVYSVRDYSMFYNEVNKVFKGLSKRDIKKIFFIKYKGHEFNCLPFLLNGTGYFSSTYRSSLTDSVARLSMITEPFSPAELEHIDGLDIKLFDTVLPALMDLGIRMLGAYQYKHQPKELIKLLYRGSVEVFESVILGGSDIHFDYKYKDICNTQAFCYYISILWLLSLSPFLKTLVAKELRHAKFDALMDSIIPEGSLHFKYICGEITSDELFRLYTERNFSDGSSICLREIMSNSTDGAYKGEDLDYKEVGICAEIYDNYTLNEDYKMNMHIAYCFLFDGTYERLNNEISTQTVAKERENAKANKKDNRLKQARDEITSLNSKLRVKDKEISLLKSELHSISTDDELKSEIELLKDEIKSLKSENEQLFTERTSMKQLISSQKKQLKSFSSSIAEEENVDEDLSESIESVSLEEAVECIKNLRITYVGCDNTSIDSKFESLGLTNITRFNSNQRTIGKCDILVIFAIRCHHADVYRAEKLCKDIPILYLNCSNAEQMIMSVYEATKKG